MNRTFSQKEIGDFLKANPLNVKFHIGDLENMNGGDYIFLDYLSDGLIAYDDEGCYKTTIQISIYTQDFHNRFILTNYVKKLTQFNIVYQGSQDGNYFVAVLQSEIFING